MSDPVLHDVLAALNIAIFERAEQRHLRLIGEAPHWLSALWPSATQRGERLRPETSPFLENFLVDAITCWDAPTLNSDRVYSGPWVEQDSAGRDHHLQAFALNAGGRAVLVIEEMGVAYAERVTMLQTAHEAALAFEKLQRAEQSLANQKHLLEVRVIERTEQLSASRERLRELSMRLVKLQEEERRFFARELHDEIGQLLTSVKLSLDLLGKKVPANCQPALGESVAIVNDLLERVRRLSLKLRPQMLDDFGLLPALEWHIKRYRTQTAIPVDLNHELSGKRFEDAVETAIYRIVQESLTNIARHSKATRADVRLHLRDRSVHLEVTDNGIGFDPAAPQSRPSTGISSMAERAELLGGTLFIESTPGSGTCVIVELPCSRMMEQAPLPPSIA